MNLQRRKFIKTATGVAALGAVPWYISRQAFAGYSYQEADFINPLGFPVQYFGKVKNGKRVFTLKIQQGKSRFFKGLQTPTLGINGNYLGPVLRIRQGEEALIRVRNQLPQASTLHWHGLILPAKMDGGPHQPIAPGKSWQAQFQIIQGAATQWYHSHLHQQTGAQVYQGLAGLFYIDDDFSQQAELPKDYAIDDIPLVLQDRNFNKDGSFRYISSMHEAMTGIQGSHILINGVVRPRLQIERRQVRFRILNGSNARVYQLHFSDNRKFVQIASDGGFLPKPVQMQRLILSPGERAEILVQFEANESVMLQHKPLPKNNFGFGMMGMMLSVNDRPFNLLRIESKNAGGDIHRLPEQLITMPSWFDHTPQKHRQFELNMSMGMGMMAGGRGGGLTINGKSFELERIDEVVKINTTELWEFSNQSPMAHPLHIHDTQFKIISRNGKQPPRNERGFKDTVYIRPGETVQLLNRFQHYSDPQTPYMYHCHILEHEDQGMMGQFVVSS